MLGDSLTRGIGVNSQETFSRHLETIFNSTIVNCKYRAINAGVADSPPLLECIYLELYGMQLTPDLVILDLDLSEMYDDIQHTKRAQFDQKGTPVAVVPVSEPPRRSWLRQTLVTITVFFREHLRLCDLTSGASNTF